MFRTALRVSVITLTLISVAATYADEQKAARLLILEAAKLYQQGQQLLPEHPNELIRAVRENPDGPKGSELLRQARSKLQELIDTYPTTDEGMALALGETVYGFNLAALDRAIEVGSQRENETISYINSLADRTTPPTESGYEHHLALNNHYSKGVAGAPVVIKEFSDYTSPHSKTLQETMERVLARFEGDVQLVLYPFTLNPTSEVATQAALCAGEQGKFWEFHRMLYARLEQWRRLPDPRQRLEEIALDVGVDTAALADCVKGGRMQKLIDADKAFGRSLGVRSAPALFINDKRIVGAQPDGNFLRAVRQELDRARWQAR